MPKDHILRNQTMNLALMKEMLKNMSETVTLKNLVSIGCNTFYYSSAYRMMDIGLMGIGKK